MQNKMNNLFVKGKNVLITALFVVAPFASAKAYNSKVACEPSKQVAYRPAVPAVLTQNRAYDTKYSREQSGKQNAYQPAIATSSAQGKVHNNQIAYMESVKQPAAQLTSTLQEYKENFGYDDNNFYEVIKILYICEISFCLFGLYLAKKESCKKELIRKRMIYQM